MPNMATERLRRRFLALFHLEPVDAEALYQNIMALYDRRRQRPDQVEMFWRARPATWLVSGALTSGGYVLAFGFLSASGFFVSVLVGLVTALVMAFNDLVDRHHDTQKGKLFAREKSFILGSWLASWVCVGILALASLMEADAWPGIYVACIWALGFMYSFVPHRFIVQNSIVAICTAAPILCGPLSARRITAESLLVALAIFWVMMAWETLKDIEDRGHDRGYKATIAVRYGPRTAAWAAIGFSAMAGLTILLPEEPAIRILALCFVWAQAGNAAVLFKPEKTLWPKAGLAAFLLLLIVLLIGGAAGDASL